MLQLSPWQYGLTAVHIVCKKGNLNILRKLLSTAKQQNVYCSVKGRQALPTDCQVVLLARAKKVIVTCSLVICQIVQFTYYEGLESSDVCCEGRTCRTLKGVFS